MKFRISTAMLLLTIFAICMAWYVAHNKKLDLVGSWHCGLGTYRTFLELKADGTFTKTQINRSEHTVYRGNYLVYEEGLVVFNVSEIRDAINAERNLDFDVEESFWCRCAIAPSGHLLIKSIQGPTIPKEIGLRWEVYEKQEP